MYLDVDEDAEASYFCLSEEHVARTRSVTDSIMIDYDALGRVVGVEVLGPIPEITEAFRVQLGVEEEVTAKMQRLVVADRVS